MEMPLLPKHLFGSPAIRPMRMVRKITEGSVLVSVRRIAGIQPTTPSRAGAMVIELPVAPVVSIVPDLKGGFGMGIFGFVEAELKEALPSPKRKKGRTLLTRNSRKRAAAW